jgi:CheY-like chemotaxis protein
MVTTDYKMQYMSGLDFTKHIGNIVINFLIKIILIVAFVQNNLVIDKSNN